MNKRNLAAALSLATLMALAGCHGGPKGVFAATKHGAPDEFAVGRQAPLTVPPDFALVPPRPGQPRPQETDSSTQALQALFGGPHPVSQGEAVLTQTAGAPPPPGMRTEASAARDVVVDKGATTRDILKAPPTANPQANANAGGTAPQGTTPQP
jgi:hypothetical protein